MKKIFITDYDGTLFQNGTVTEKDLEMIHSFRKKGGLFGIATGRIVNSIRHEVEKYDIPVDFVVGVNGAMLMDGSFNKLHSFDIEEGLALEVLAFLRDNGAIHYSISDGYNIHRQGLHTGTLRDFYVPFEEVLANKVRGLYGKMQTRDESFKICEAINNQYGNHIQALPNYNYLDMASSKTDKYYAIEKYLNLLDDEYEVATAGDAHNDLKMLKNYKGYAMRHGDPVIVNQIERKVDTVAEAIEAFLNN